MGMMGLMRMVAKEFQKEKQKRDDES